MAKRDKLYTVNKWNKPFFEEEKRKRLYNDGGRRPIWGLKENQGGLWNSYGVLPTGFNSNPRISSLAQLNIDNPGVVNNPGVANLFQHTNQPWYGIQMQPYKKTSIDEYNKILNTASVNNPTTTSVQRPAIWNTISNTISAIPDVVLAVNRLTNTGSKTANTGATTAAFAEAPSYTFDDFIKGYDKFALNNEITSTANQTKPYIGIVNSSLARNIARLDIDQAGKDFAKVLADKSTLSLPDKSGLKHLTLDLDSGAGAATKSGISSLGKAGINLGASIGSEFGYNWISNGLSTGAGQAIKNIGSAAGIALQFIPGVGWAAAPIVTLASGILGGIANQWGHKTFDNGATAYTNRLNNLNPNGSNEYLANLMASTGIGPRATYKDGWFTDKGKHEARNINTAQDLAYSRFQRGIRDAFTNNNTRQLWNAYNDYVTYGAMGGKLNKCKCNKKSYGGYLDSATPTGFNFLSDLTNIQMQKNQNQGGTATSVGNSFMNTPDMGITFAKGGIMIKPENRGKLTRLKKRTGKTEAELYNDGNPEHRKMVVFARNARKWKKALGGKIDYGEDKDIRNNSFFSGQTMYDLGGILQAAGTNWGNVSQINEGGTHEENPYEGVQVGVDPEGTPNLVEEGEVIWNDYVFSNRITVPKEVCKRLRIGQKKNGYTFADAAKKLLVESKERPNDPISKNGLEANMQLLEDAQEEVKRKMEAEQAVEQFNSLPPEQQVAIMNQEGQRALDAVAQEQMAQEIQNMPPEQQQAIAQQMMAEQAAAQGLGMPQGQPSPEEQAMMQQQMAQQQGINPQEAIAQASAMLQQALGGMALGGKLCFGGRKLAEGGELNGEQPVEQPDNEMAKYSDEELQDMIDDYQEAESGEVKVTKGKLARLRKKAEKALAELERRHAEENTEQPQEARQEPSQEEVQAAALALAQQQMMEGQPQEGISPEQAVMMQQQMGGQPLMSPEEMAAAELQQLTGQQYAYGGKVNKYAYAGSLKPQPIGPGIAREVQEPYGRHPDIPQEVYDWFLSLSPEERFDLFGSSPTLNMRLENYGTDSWYDRNKPIPNKEGSSRWWSQYVTKAKGEESHYMRQAILDAYKNRRDTSGKYIPYNLSQDIINWYATLPESERKRIIANTKMKGRDFSTVIRYANTGAPKAVANAILEAYNAANGQIPALALTSDVTSTAANTPTSIPMPIYSGLSTTGANLMKLLGFKSTKDAPITLDELGIKSWNDKVDPSKVKRETLEKATNPVIKHLLNLGWSPFYNGPTEDQWWENSGGAEINFSDAGVYDKGYTKEDVNKLAKRYPQVRWALENNADFINGAYKNGRISGKDLIKAFENSPMWTSTNDYLFNSPDALLHQLDYLARRRQYDTGNQDSRFLNTWGKFGDFTQDPVTGKWSYKLKKGVDPNKFTETFRNLRNDGKFGTMYDVRQIPTLSTTNYVLDENGNPTEEIIFDTDGYTQVGNPYIYYSANTDDPLSPGVNNTISYWKKNSSNTDSSTTDDESNYLTVGWKPKIDYTGLALGVAPGLTGLAMQLGRGAPDMSELDKAVAAYERNTGTMIAPHLTHGLIRPAIIDPRVTENSLNARRLGTNRLLMNTGSTPSRGATILANDANTIGQLGQAMINNWRENRAQEQAAATFNRETNTTNANILNQVDQFNDQTQSALARDAAQLRYNVAKDKIAARDAYYAGLMGNLGSVFKGGYEAWRENQRKNERDLLAASGVFGETNSLIDDWLGISKVDPKTHKVVRGYNTGMYYLINPNTGKAEYLKTPPLATTPINACGGKIKKNKKRKGYTF